MTRADDEIRFGCCATCSAVERSAELRLALKRTVAELHAWGPVAEHTGDSWKDCPHPICRSAMLLTCDSPESLNTAAPPIAVVRVPEYPVQPPAPETIREARARRAMSVQPLPHQIMVPCGVCNVPRPVTRSYAAAMKKHGTYPGRCQSCGTIAYMKAHPEEWAWRGHKSA